MDRINKLVKSYFDSNVVDIWLSEEFQKKLKKVTKPKKEKKEKKEKDEEQEDSKPKTKAQTPYIKFCMAERENLKKEHPSLSAKEITAKLGECWNNHKATNEKYLEKNYGYKPKPKPKN